MNETIKNTLLAAGTMMILATASGTASADERASDPVISEFSTRVTLHDLDLTSRDDVETAYERIGTAAKQACRKAGRRYVRLLPRRLASCVEAAIGNAVDEISAPQLTLLHRGSEEIFADR
ncbi:MAG: UrcA family protein [Gammaproteobacteria bacterium]|nr:UrcA family protein [Gammaproteobacteria bacterium]